MPWEGAGACAKLVRVPTFGDNCFVPTHVGAAASSGSSLRRGIRKTMPEKSVRKSMIVHTSEAEGQRNNRMKRKKTYEFSLVLTAPTLSIEDCDALYEAGCDDGTIV